MKTLLLVVLVLATLGGCAVTAPTGPEYQGPGRYVYPPAYGTYSNPYPYAGTPYRGGFWQAP